MAKIACQATMQPAKKVPTTTMAKPPESIAMSLRRYAPLWEKELNTGPVSTKAATAGMATRGLDSQAKRSGVAARVSHTSEMPYCSSASRSEATSAPTHALTPSLGRPKLTDSHRLNRYPAARASSAAAERPASSRARPPSPTARGSHENESMETISGGVGSAGRGATLGPDISCSSLGG